MAIRNDSNVSFHFCSAYPGFSCSHCNYGNDLCKTNNEEYKTMAKFWGKLFLINFAVGIVTGITLEFQFGMNWAEYSRFVGDVLELPLQ